jgi:myo-inositol 2-dehydrogenase / D-chiro-inositol 1-dehydrogenase
MKNQVGLDRRAFLSTGAAFTIMAPNLVRGTERNSAVRLGLLGCGGRGTGVTASFIQNTGAQVTALADLFEDSLTAAHQKLNEVAAKKGKPGIDAANLFRGPRACESIMASKAIDAIYIATPPIFHPQHLEAAVAAGRHVYVEKPVAVDVPGAKRVLQIGERANGRLSLAVGFQIRHATPFVEMVKRIHAGALGRVVCGLTQYYAGGIKRPDWPSASPAERRLRNWVHYRVLSGDIIVEQNVHIIDVTNWVLNAHPLKAIGTGGRFGRTDQGDCWSHFSCTYTYPQDTHITMNSTQFIQGIWDVGMRYFGTRGNAEAHYDSPVRITGEEPWEFPGLGPAGQNTDSKAAVTGVFHGALDDADPNKQNSFIESIRSGKYLNQAKTGVESALSGILGRTAAYTGREVTWEELLRSQEVWEPGVDITRL